MAHQDHGPRTMKLRHAWMAHVKISSQAGPNQTPEGEIRVVAAQSHPPFSNVAALRGRTSFTERPKQGASHDFCAAWIGIRRQYCRFWAGPNGKRQATLEEKLRRQPAITRPAQWSRGTRGYFPRFPRCAALAVTQDQRKGRAARDERKMYRTPSQLKPHRFLVARTV